MFQYTLFAGAYEHSVTLGSCDNHGGLARDRLKLVDFVRRGEVPESRRYLDDELGCLRIVGSLVNEGRGSLDLGVLRLLGAKIVLPDRWRAPLVPGICEPRFVPAKTNPSNGRCDIHRRTASRSVQGRTS